MSSFISLDEAAAGRYGFSALDHTPTQLDDDRLILFAQMDQSLVCRLHHPGLLGEAAARRLASPLSVRRLIQTGLLCPHPSQDFSYCFMRSVITSGFSQRGALMRRTRALAQGLGRWRVRRLRTSALLDLADAS